MALIYLTDQIRNEIDRGKYASRIFSYFPKAFDDHMQMEKIEYFVFREISNNGLFLILVRESCC